MNPTPSSVGIPAETPGISRIIAAAEARAQAQGLAYAGALTPQEAHALLQAIPEARLIDVRTRAEWHWVGRVPQALEIEWQSWPEGERNPHFLDTLQGLVPPGVPLLFLCRSGVRSHHAAVLASSHGFAACFNILEGFEGDKDSQGQRGTLGGWRRAGLPWQS